MALTNAASTLQPPRARARDERNGLLAFVADPATEEAVAKAAAELRLGGVETKRGGIGKAIQHLAAARSPEILIVDIAGIDLPISEFLRLAEFCEPGVHVLAVGERNDIALYRDLLQVGVSDYLVKPITAELVRKSIQSIVGGADAVRISDKQGKLVVFHGARGGAGTTTLAANVAWHLAERCGRRVGLIDLDLQNGECGLLLDVQSTGELRAMLEAPDRIDGLFVERTMAASGERLFVLSAEEPIEDEMRFDAAAVERLLSVLRTQFHYVVVDLPRPLGRAGQRVLELASLRVVVADLTLRSLRDVARLRSLAQGFDESGRTVVVVNRRGEHGKGEVPLERFAEATGLSPAAVVPYEPKTVAAAAAYGTPVAAQRGGIAAAIGKLSLEISGQQAARPGLLRRIFR